MDLISPKAEEFFLQQPMGAGAETHGQTLSREGPNWRFLSLPLDFREPMEEGKKEL